MFPGYIFVQINLENFNKLKFTKGIKNIVKFGHNIPFISDNDINNINNIEKESESNPVSQELSLGQEVAIINGPLRGIFGKISSLPKKNRVEVLISFLGSLRRINIIRDDIC